MMLAASMGTIRDLFRGDGLRVVEHVCAYGPEDRPFEEEHGAFTVAFVVDGAFDVRSATGPAALGPGSVLLGNDGDRYTCVHPAGQGDVCVSFAYSARVVEEAASSLGVKPRFRGATLGPSPAFAAMPAIARSSPGTVEENALRLLGLALAADAGSPRLHRCGPAEDRRAVEALRHIEAHADEPLSLSALAERARLTRFHFLRSFRAAVGSTPYQSLLAARLRRAARLLLETRLPVTDVAFEAGFGDLSNFIRTLPAGDGPFPAGVPGGARRKRLGHHCRAPPPVRMVRIEAHAAGALERVRETSFSATPQASRRASRSGSLPPTGAACSSASSARPSWPGT
jgi:AraC-like DNA-binding protein